MLVYEWPAVSKLPNRYICRHLKINARIGQSTATALYLRSILLCIYLRYKFMMCRLHRFRCFHHLFIRGVVVLLVPCACRRSKLKRIFAKWTSLECVSRRPCFTETRRRHRPHLQRMAYAEMWQKKKVIIWSMTVEPNEEQHKWCVLHLNVRLCPSPHHPSGSLCVCVHGYARIVFTFNSWTIFRWVFFPHLFIHLITAFFYARCFFRYYFYLFIWLMLCHFWNRLN